MPRRDPAQIIDAWWQHTRPELLRAFTTATSADEPWDGSEDRDLTPDDEAKVSAWVSRHRKPDFKRGKSGQRPRTAKP